MRLHECRQTDERSKLLRILLSTQFSLALLSSALHIHTAIINMKHLQEAVITKTVTVALVLRFPWNLKPKKFKTGFGNEVLETVTSFTVVQHQRYEDNTGRQAHSASSAHFVDKLVALVILYVMMFHSAQKNSRHIFISTS